MSFSSKRKAFFGISKPPQGGRRIHTQSKIATAAQPVDHAHTLPRASLEAGSFRGSLKNWVPQQTHLRSQQAFERDLAIARVDELYGNDGIAKSGVNSIATNVIGCGLTPQSIIPAKQLGLEPEAVIEIQDQMEWLWAEWCAQAHYRDQLHFEDLQMIGLRSLIRNGEMLHLPVMDERPGCRFALRIQGPAAKESGCGQIRKWRYKQAYNVPAQNCQCNGGADNKRSR